MIPLVRLIIMIILVHPVPMIIRIVMIPQVLITLMIVLEQARRRQWDKKTDPPPVPPFPLQRRVSVQKEE